MDTMQLDQGAADLKELDRRLTLQADVLSEVVNSIADAIGADLTAQQQNLNRMQRALKTGVTKQVNSQSALLAPLTDTLNAAVASATSEQCVIMNYAQSNEMDRALPAGCNPIQFKNKFGIMQTAGPGQIVPYDVWRQATTSPQCCPGIVAANPGTAPSLPTAQPMTPTQQPPTPMLPPLPSPTGASNAPPVPTWNVGGIQLPVGWSAYTISDDGCEIYVAPTLEGDGTLSCPSGFPMREYTTQGRRVIGCYVGPNPGAGPQCGGTAVPQVPVPTAAPQPCQPCTPPTAAAPTVSVPGGNPTDPVAQLCGGVALPGVTPVQVVGTDAIVGPMASAWSNCGLMAAEAQYARFLTAEDVARYFAIDPSGGALFNVDDDATADAILDALDRGDKEALWQLLSQVSWASSKQRLAGLSGQ